MNKSQSMNIPRQTHGESGGLEMNLSTLRRIKSAYGRSRSITAEEGDRSQGILVIFIAIVVAMPTIMKNCPLNLLIIISPSNKLSPTTQIFHFPQIDVIL